MRLLIYASRHHGASQRLLDSVRNLSDSHHCDCAHYDELPLLIDALHHSRIGSRMAVLFPSNHDELARLVTLKHLLLDLQIILILPNVKSQTLSHGHALRPRFISYADSDFSDVAAVSDKLLRRLAVAPTSTGIASRPVSPVPARTATPLVRVRTTPQLPGNTASMLVG